MFCKGVTVRSNRFEERSSRTISESWKQDEKHSDNSPEHNHKMLNHRSKMWQPYLVDTYLRLLILNSVCLINDDIPPGKLLKHCFLSYHHFIRCYTSVPLSREHGVSDKMLPKNIQKYINLALWPLRVTNIYFLLTISSTEITNKGDKNKGNNHQLKKLWIVTQILIISMLGNV